MEREPFFESSEEDHANEERARAEASVYAGFIRGSVGEDETIQLLQQIEQNENQSVMESLKHLSDHLSVSLESAEKNQWKAELMRALDVIEMQDVDNDSEIRFARSIMAHHLFGLQKKYLGDGKSLSVFTQDVREWLHENSSRVPAIFELPGDVIEGKRQPGFIESVDETLKRYEAIEKTVESLRDKVDGILFGGSMSYGPFFNVRGDRDETGASDLDGIVVLQGDAMPPVDKIFDEQAAEVFSERFAHFQKLRTEADVDVMTQKSKFRDEDFDISIHFFPQDVFKKMTGEQFETSIQNDDVEVLFKDYRPQPFRGNSLDSHNFDGSTFEYDIPDQEKTKVGVVATLPAYRVHENKLYTGVYQNVISPGFDVWYDRDGSVSKEVDFFRNALRARMKTESKTGQAGTFEKSHIRQNLFSPHFIERLSKEEK